MKTTAQNGVGGRAGPDRRITAMIFRLEIKCNNAAFYEDDGRETPEVRGSEVARILREIAEHVQVDVAGGPVLDVNGNTVGQYGYEKRGRR